MKNLSEELREYLLEQGASIVGFADPNELPLSDRNGYRFGVSFVIALKPEAVRAIYPGPSLEYYKAYRNVSDRAY